MDILPKDTPLSELVEPEEYEDDNVPLAELISIFPREEGETPMSASQFVEMDNGLETGELLTDDAILSLSKLEPRDCSVNDASEEEDDDDVGDDAILKKVTKGQARNSLNDVINYLEQQGTHFDPKYLDSAWALMSAINNPKTFEVQKSIKDFFH